MEIRSKAGRIVGELPYNSLSEDLGKFREKLIPGVFSKTLESGQDIYFLWSHDSSKPLGSTASGSLKLYDTPASLKFELELPDNTAGMDARVSIARGDVKGLSFGFHVKEERWEEINGQQVRVVYDADLLELSAVIWPAYGKTWIGARNLRNN